MVEASCSSQSIIVASTHHWPQIPTKLGKMQLKQSQTEVGTLQTQSGSIHWPTIHGNEEENGEISCVWQEEQCGAPPRYDVGHHPCRSRSGANQGRTHHGHMCNNAPLNPKPVAIFVHISNFLCSVHQV
jgi:hypothetical protein